MSLTPQNGARNHGEEELICYLGSIINFSGFQEKQIFY